MTTWNILEFKSPGVTPRLQHLDLLIEVGLGVERRLNEEKRKKRLHPVVPAQVSFWYLANRLSPRFPKQCEERLSRLAPAGQGLWYSQVTERPLVLVSNADLPVDTESLPLHIASQASHETELALARFVVERPELQENYATWIAALHDSAWKEVGAMAQSTKGLKINYEAMADYIGPERLIDDILFRELSKKKALTGCLRSCLRS